MQEILHRLKAPTPAFWKKVRRFGLFLGSAGTAMAAAAPVLPPWLPIAGGYCVVAGGVVVALASLTCEDTPTLN
ncbi:hypothetical protein [Hymenobacter metallilatus]|uniref:Uncharacterized protein n=1 Tax=Hymenobacter metallilatus TaxID=2493666 RepID=A0A428JLT1_9BACT|nr:hypothetical protein [Hymenobacter metallilatus]RSK33967.1 hypothetical protein EI290_09685 [Hymenobacter metallilatus]